jgi:hypothetical protein
MQDDEKMFNIGWISLVVVVGLVAFLQVCYREQNKNIRDVRNEIENTKHELEIAETKFSTLSSSDSLRNSVTGINPKATVVSFSKTVHIDEIPMVQE